MKNKKFNIHLRDTGNDSWIEVYDNTDEILNILETVDVQENNKGEWIIPFNGISINEKNTDKSYKISSIAIIDSSLPYIQMNWNTFAIIKNHFGRIKSCFVLNETIFGFYTFGVNALSAYPQISFQLGSIEIILDPEDYLYFVLKKYIP